MEGKGGGNVTREGERGREKNKERRKWERGEVKGREGKQSKGKRKELKGREWRVDLIKTCYTQL